MKANKTNPTLIRITSNGHTLGHMTCEEFRTSAGSASGANDFIGNLVDKFNAWKQEIGEPERALQVLNLGNGKTI